MRYKRTLFIAYNVYIVNENLHLILSEIKIIL